MKRIRRSDEGIILELERGEAGFLRGLPAHIGLGRGPTRYAEDSRTDGEMRDLLDADLAAKRATRTQSVLEQLAAVKSNRLVLNEHQAEDWLAMLTELRLALAEIIGIKDESWEQSVDVSKPLPENVRLYYYLTSLQSALLDGGFGVAQSDVAR